MDDQKNQDQILRKDARGCFVESLSDSFTFGKAHFAFASYDVSKPAGHRQTNSIHIYMDIAELMEIGRQLAGGEMRFLLQQKRKAGDRSPIRQWLGGTSAEKLRSSGRPRPDGKSLSRTAQLLCGSKTDFLLVAESGPGETNEKGLIVPRFGNKPENHVAISLSFDAFSELILVTEAHYRSWLTAWYLSKEQEVQQKASKRPAVFPMPMAVPEKSPISMF